MFTTADQSALSSDSVLPAGPSGPSSHLASHLTDIQNDVADVDNIVSCVAADDDNKSTNTTMMSVESSTVDHQSTRVCCTTASGDAATDVQLNGNYYILDDTDNVFE